MMRIADCITESIVDGPGLRMTVFVQGCPHHCPGCQNPGTHDFSGGHEVGVAELCRCYAENPLLDGLTLSGGEPMCQPEDCAALARAVRALGGNVWVYTGFLYEALTNDPARRALLDEADVLVDGPFLQAQRSLELRWRGSANQRVIDLRATRRNGILTLWKDDAC